MARRKRTARPLPIVVGRYRVTAVRQDAQQRDLWYWRAREYVGNAETTVWTGWATRDEAERQVGSILSTGRPATVGGCDTVRDLLLMWRAAQDKRGDLATSSKATIKSAVRQLVAGMGDVQLARFGWAELSAYRDRRLGPEPPSGKVASRKDHPRGRLPRYYGASPYTVDRELRFLNEAWTWAQRSGLIARDREYPDVSINLKPTRVRHTPCREEVAAVLEQLPSGWTQLAVRLLYATGCRLSEVARIRGRDVDLLRNEIRVDGKTGPRDVPVDAEVLQGLAAHLPEDPDRRLLADVTVETIRTSLRRYLEDATSAAGQPFWTAQDLRRAACDELYDMGLDAATVASVLGHSVETALKYYRLRTPAKRRAAIAKARRGGLPAHAVPVVPGSGNPGA